MTSKTSRTFDQENIRAHENLMRARHGDQTALRDLMELAAARASRITWAWSIPGFERDDVTQEVLFAAWRGLQTFCFGRGVPLTAFVEMCMRRRLVSLMRSKTAAQARALTMVPLDAQEEFRIATGADPATRHEDSETMRRLINAVQNELSELERDVLHLYLQGSPYEAIAHAVHRHVKAVDNALQRSRRKLARALRRDGPA